MEPCLSCGRTDQPERFHTHPAQPSQPSKEKEKDARSSRHKSPLKESKQNLKESDKAEPGQNHLKEKPPNNRRPRRSQSPRKSLSPEKAVSPVETSETHSPQLKRRQKTSKNNEKENEDNSRRSQKVREVRVSKQKQEGESRNKPNKTEFTVDIFTSKTNQEREGEDAKPRDEDKKAGRVGGGAGGELSEESGEEVELPSVSSPVSLSSRPTVKCQTCGKEFGKSSLKFHEPQCRKKKIAEDLRKEKEKSVVEEKPVSYTDHITGKDLDETKKEHSVFVLLGKNVT